MDHAVAAEKAWRKVRRRPRADRRRAVQGASCFGPAYEFTMIMKPTCGGAKSAIGAHDLRHLEPYIGHLGLGASAIPKGLMESIFRNKHIKWICNAKVTRVEAGGMFVTEHDGTASPGRSTSCPSSTRCCCPPSRASTRCSASTG